MKKKGFLILVLLISIISIILTTSVSADCCINSFIGGSCDPNVNTQEACEDKWADYAMFYTDDCLDVTDYDCTIGCCCTPTADVTSKKVCGELYCSDLSCFSDQGWGITPPADANDICISVCTVAQQEFQLTAIVKDNEGNLLDGVGVDVITHHTSCTTDESGQCTMSVKGGYIQVRAEKDGFIPIIKTLILDENMDLFFTLFPEECNTPDATPPPDTFFVSDVLLKPELKLTWNNFCDANEFVIYWCETDLEECTPDSTFYTTTETFFIDDGSGNGLNPETTYCYKIKANYDSWYEESAVVCQDTGNEFCLNAPNPSLTYYEFCLDNSIYQCDEENIPEKIEDCNTFECKSFGKTGKAWCEDVDTCRACSGILGMFWATNLNLNLCLSNELCFLDYSKTTVDMFSGCYDNPYFSCYDYKSEEACSEGKENNCLLTQCEFEEHPFYNEFGKGICRPANIEEQNCELCNENQDFFIQCNEYTCPLYGDNCYFGELSGCSSPENLMCREYENEQDCTGGSPVNVDVQWSSGTKISGTNEKTPSQDNFGIGVCKWGQPQLESKTRCYKDADNDDKSDCSINNLELCRDNQPPTTTLDHLKQITTGQFEIIFNVVDNMDTNPIIYFCSDKTNTCYPNTEVPNSVKKIQSTDLGFEEDDRYFLRFFAEDASHNLELIQSKQVLIGEGSLGPTLITVTVGTTHIIKEGVTQTP